MGVIAPARYPDDIEVVRTLFREYIDGLGVDLSFQDVESELAGLPGKYEPPSGTILIARNGTAFPIGCIALRPLPDTGLAK